MLLPKHLHHQHRYIDRHYHYHFLTLLLLLPQLNQNLLTSAYDQECSHSQSQDLACPTDEAGNPYTCRIGTKDYQTLFPGVNYLSTCTTNGQSTYCDCNEHTKSVQRDGSRGYTGCRCQTPFAVCPDGTTCFNGAPCVRVGDEETYICGCAYASGDTTWVGEHCEYEPEDICEKTKYDVSHKGNWFCANGYCNDAIVNPSEKCSCDDGYYGLHCEFINKPPKCDTICQNNGICTRGFKPSATQSKEETVWSDDLNDRRDLLEQETSSYCVCPEGFTGLTCEIRVDVSNKGCEEFPCQHGSTCRQSDETQDYYCDCSTIEEKDAKGNLVPYAGERCEHKISTQCEVPEGYDKSNYFCTNGGVCPLSFHDACICPIGTSGPRCEFLTEEPTKECSLQCFNSGQCFFGSYPPNTNPYNIDFTKPENSEMHCKCPEGHIGAVCEIHVVLCPGGTHACANNGNCAKDGEEWMCDCSKALLGATPARGEKCENPATSYCIGPGANLDSFCTNDGVCRDYVVLDGKSHPGCICRKGFYGDYCEFYDPNYHKSGVAQKAFLGFMISLFLLLLLFLIWKFSQKDYREPIPKYNHMDEQNRNMQVPDGYVPDDPVELPDEYEDGDDINLEGMDNVIGMDHVYVN